MQVTSSPSVAAWRLRRAAERQARRAAVLACLERCGPLTTAQLARRLRLPSARLNQWLVAESARSLDWVRMPNRRWLPTHE